MPVTKTARRALRSSKKKTDINKRIVNALQVAVRQAKRDKKQKNLDSVFSLADRAAKAHVIHRKKADRIKSRVTKRILSA